MSNAYVHGASLVGDVSRGAHADPAARPAARPPARLEWAAHQFEASLMEEMLKPMQEDPLFGEDTGRGGTGGDGGGLGSAGTIRSLGTEAMARALSERGGLGIARKVVEKVMAEHTGRI